METKQNDKAPRTSNRWQVTLEIRHQPGPGANFPYSYRVVLVGQFGVAASVKNEDEQRTIKVHGASVLYGMAREIVRALTGRGPYRPVILPTVSFYEQKSAATVSTSSTPPKIAPLRAEKRSKGAPAPI